MNALFVLRPAKLRAFNFGHPCPSLVKGEVLSPTKIRATTGGIATPPFAPHQPFQNRTILPTFRRARGACPSRCIEYCHSHNHCKKTIIPRKSPTPLPPLSKVRCCRPKKFGRLPEGLSLHHPFQNRTITLAFRTAIVCVCLYGFAFKLSHLAFRRARVCVCLVGFASIAIVVVCGRWCVTASSAISVAASCSD